MTELPKGWVWATVENLITEKVINGRSVTTRTGGFPVLKLNAIKNGNVDLSVTKEGNWSKEEAEPYRVRSGDFLVSRGNGNLNLVGRGGLVVSESRSAGFPDTMMRLRVDCSVVSPRYFKVVWGSEVMRRQIEGFARTTAGIFKINQKILLDLKIPLPPLVEQRRIVAALEEQFPRLASADATLNGARTRLSMARESALQGELENIKFDLRPLAGLLKEKIVNGRSVPSREGGFPVLRLNAIKEEGVDLSCFKEGAWSVHEAEPFLVSSGDFLLCRGNGTLSLVGRGALVRDVGGSVAFPDTMMRIRVNEDIVATSYLDLIWKSRFIRNQIESEARTTAGIYKVNQGILKRIEIPVPSRDEQNGIVSRMRDLSDGVTRLQEALANAETQSKRLRRSLLSAAFSGKLAPQDTDDEPASVLLERINAQRVTASAPVRGHRSSKKRAASSSHTSEPSVDARPVPAGEQTALEI